MDLELTDEQESFRDVVRRFIETEVPLTTVRALYEHREGFDRGWWRQAAELGWTSMFVPEEQGGGSLSGRPVADAVIVAEEMGRTLSPGPFVAVNTVAFGVSADGSDDQKGALLPGLVTGEEIATWAFAEADGRWDVGSLSTTAEVRGDRVVISGSKSFVEAIGSATSALVTARTGDGLTQVLVPLGAEGVTVVSGRSIDMTRRFGSLHLDAVDLPLDAVVGQVGEAGETVERQRRLALALQCAEMVGIADRTLEFTLEYGKDRFAFGRPIVSFQALKHRIADMAQWLEASMATSEALVSTIDAGDADVDVDVEMLASVAKAYVGEKVPLIVDDCVQITGGIGVTWEHDIHMYNRRAILDRAVYGSPEEHKEQVFVLLDRLHGGED